MNNTETSKRFRLNRVTMITFVTVVLIVIILGLAGFIFYSPREELYTGRVEVKEIRISGKVPGRITRIYVDEGDSVRAGDTLVSIYSPEVLAKQKQAQAADKAAFSFMQSNENGTQGNLQNMALEAWTGAKAALESGEKSFARAEKLYKEGVISAQQFDEYEAKIKALRAAEIAAHSQYDLSKKGIFANKNTTRALSDRTEGLLDEVDAYLKEGALISPIDGIVADIFPNAGELVGTGAPIMNISDMKTIRVLFSIREDKLSNLKKGMILKGRVIALDNKSIDLKVTKLKDMGSYAVWKATKPTDDVDIRTFEVTMIPLNNTQDLLPGMTVVLNKGQIK